MRGGTEAMHYDRKALARTAGELRLRLVVLHGSRAEGRAEVGSDIDIAVLADGAVDEARRLELYRRLGTLIGGASLDISLLNGAQPNFLAVVADTGHALYEVAPGEFLRFQSLAARMFCDAQKWQAAQWEHLGGERP
jgi:predicted nucleotidyltransferase